MVGGNFRRRPHPRPICVNDVAAGEAEAVAAALPGAVSRGHDVADPAGAAALVALAHSELGALDGLVNNAGLYYESEPWDEEPARLHRLVEVNVLGPFSARPRLRVSSGRRAPAGQS